MQRREALSVVAGGVALTCVGCSQSTAETAARFVAGATDEGESEGFGSRFLVGDFDEVLADMDRSGGFFYLPLGRAWIVRYPEDKVAEAKLVYPDAMHVGLDAGVIALFQKCPHLGCRVPECTSSDRFECPCHGSMYSKVGEHLGGPSPRGMDLFPLSFEANDLWIDTSQILAGMPIGTEIVGGPERQVQSCLGDSFS